ncbi:hypothetical protein LDENG_00162500 [Lucifuga dentata]|nr:hypothetical protein LDENG_00162500 [Lucifuga dentata]
MMVPVSMFKGLQPFGTISTTAISWPTALSITSDPAPHWLWLAGWSGTTYQATPPLLFYPPVVWMPEYTHFIQWECPTVEVPLLPLFYSSSLPSPHPPSKLAEDWISPEEVGFFLRQDKPLLLTNQIIQRPSGHAPRNHVLLLSRPQLSRHVWRHSTKTREAELDSSSSSSSYNSFSSLLQLLSTPPTVGGVLWEWAGPVLPKQHGKEVWPVKEARPVTVSTYLNKKSCPPPFVSLDRWLHPHMQCVIVSLDREEEEEEEVEEKEKHEEGNKDKRPVASSPVPGSPWCVVWTGDDRVFFFNPSIHLSVWEKPGDLIGQDITHIIEDPPHKRKKMSPIHEEDEDEHNSKKNRLEEPVCLLPDRGDIKLVPLDVRVAHFREMMLERGVSAFSSWDKELHKMVFDPRYLLLTSDQRKQVFDQFVKSRVKEEYKEKKNKLLKTRDDFKRLLGEAKITTRSTFKEFCVRYHGDRRFIAFSRKREQEALFNNYMISLKKRDKENRARLRKMR